MGTRVILNPYSNRWRAQKRWPEAEQALQKAGIAFTLAVSQHRRHAVELAEAAVREGCNPLIVAGGDGTIGDVVNGMARGRQEEHLGTVGIIPLGTANDLACNLGLPLDLDQAAGIIAAGKSRTLDLCRAGEVYFINNAAMGLEPYITSLQQKMTLLKGIPRYLAAAIRGIISNPSWQAEISWDDGSFQGRLCLISVGNAPRTGGLFFMAPHAHPDDGRLTAVIVEKKSALALLALLPRAMTPEGRFVHAPGVQEIHATKIKVRLEEPSPAHADGELFPREVDCLEYSIIPGSIAVLAGEEGG